MRRDLVLIAIIVCGFASATIMAVVGQAQLSMAALIATVAAILFV